MKRAAGVCATTGCTNPPVTGQGRCRAHLPATAGWGGSADQRRALLPPPAIYRRLRAAIRRRARNRCEQCGAAVPAGRGQVDHRVPLLEHGPTTPENLWLLCDRCAARKTRADLERMRRTPKNDDR